MICVCVRKIAPKYPLQWALLNCQIDCSEIFKTKHFVLGCFTIKVFGTTTVLCHYKSKDVKTCLWIELWHFKINPCKKMSTHIVQEYNICFSKYLLPKIRYHPKREFNLSKGQSRWANPCCSKPAPPALTSTHLNLCKILRYWRENNI